MTYLSTSRLRRACPFLLFLLFLLFLTLTATASAQQPLTFTKSFNPATISPGGVSTLQFEITNNTASPIQNLDFTDVLPSGVTIASPANAAFDCRDGVLSAPDGGGTIAYAGGGVGGFTSCTVSVDVTSGTPGTHANVSGDLTSDAGNSGGATADLTVIGGADRPTFSKSFSPSTVAFGGRSTLTFTIDNTANPVGAILLAFTDNLPAGMVVASPNNASKTCSGGSLSAPAGSGVISYGPAPSPSSVDALSSCTLNVDVIANAAGALVNTTGNLTSISASGGPTRSSGPASATLTVEVARLALTKTFTDDPVPAGGTVTLEFTVRNLDRDSSATAITFTDDLDATLSGLEAVGLPLANPCGAGSQLSGTALLTLTGGGLAVGASCSFSVTLQVPAGAATGTYANTTSSITADLGGDPAIGAPAADVLFVQPVPVLTKSFVDDPAGAGGSATLEFTITNTSATSSATDVTFQDVFNVVLPTASATPGTGFCGAGSTATFFPLTGGVTVIPARLEVSNASLAPGASCTFSITLDVAADAATGTYPNTTTVITATVDGETLTGAAASDGLEIVAAPALTKLFTDDPVLAGDTVTLEFTLLHDENAPGDATGVTFSDDLTAALAGLEAIGLPQSDVCGTGSQIAGVTNLTFSGGTLSPGESCTFSVTLQVPSTAAAGRHANTTSNVVATVLGVTALGNAGEDDLVVAGLILTKEFIDDPALPGGAVTLRFTLENVSATDSATDVRFDDNLDNALDDLAATSLPAVTDCGAGATLTGLNGNGLLRFLDGELAPGASCSFDVPLLVPAGAEADTYVNVTTAVIASIGGSPVVLDPARDELRVDDQFLALTKEFTNDPVSPGDTVNLRFTLTNLETSRPISSIAFTDDLDAALSGLTALGLPAAACGGTASGTSTISFSGGSLAAGASCSFDVTLLVPATAPLGTIAVNATSEVTGSIVGLPVTGGAATDELAIDSLSFAKAFGGSTFPGGTVTLTFSIQNASATETVTDISFSDDLGAVLPGLAATGLPAADVCGIGSTLTGTTFLVMTGGSLLPGGSCTVMVTVQVPGSAAPGSYVNVTSDLRRGGGARAADPATATLVVEDNQPPVTAAPVVAPEPSDEGSAATASASFTDPQGAADAPFTCTVDYGDGSGPVAGTVSGFTCTGPPHVYGDNGTYLVTVEVTDRNGLSGSASAPHEVANVAPAVDAPVGTPEPSNEGGSVTAGATFSDPGFDDSPFTCAVDYGDGSGPVAGTVAGSTCTGPAHTYADDGSYAVEVSVTDKDGAAGSASSSHQVDNVAPTITASTNSAADCGATAAGDLVEVSADFSDPGFDNAAAGTFEDFTDSTIDWGDGTVEPASVDETPGSAGTPTTGTVSGSHAYAGGGIYTVTVTVADDDGGTDEVTLTALVTGVGLHDGALQIVGTAGKDSVSIKAKKGQLIVKAKLGAFGSSDDDDDDDGHGQQQSSFPAADVTLIEVQTCGGDDHVDVHHDVGVPAVLDGGEGRDHVKAGDGASFLFGGPGKDHLSGGDAGDVLDGGPGNDHLLGGQGDDVLLGGDGDDQLLGQQGDDALDGGPGFDHCVGGPGTDTEVNCELGGGGNDDDGGGGGDDDDGGGDDDDGDDD